MTHLSSASKSVGRHASWTAVTKMAAMVIQRPLQRVVQMVVQTAVQTVVQTVAHWPRSALS